MTHKHAWPIDTASITELRRKLHLIPEPGWCEYQTTAAIVNELRELPLTLHVGSDAVKPDGRMGLPPKDEEQQFYELAKQAGVDEELLTRMQGGLTGVVAVLDTGKPGPNTALRFDIDGLPITEATSDHPPSNEGFISTHHGFMHACGHDGHTAIGVHVAKLCCEYRDQLSGTLTFLFQPAEEGSRGALAMIENGWLDQQDYYLSGHIGIHDLEVGTIASGTTQFLATTKLDVHFEGVSAHAGVDPSSGKNALLAAATASLQLQAIAPHRDGVTRLNVGKLTAGEGRNIVAERATMMMETRGETDELNAYVEKEARRILQAAAEMYDVSVTIETVGRGSTAESSSSIGERLQADGDLVKRVIPPLSLGGSEDATHMMNHVAAQSGKAAYFLFGTPLPFGHHHPRFTFDEGVLPSAVAALTQLVRSYHAKETLS
ncbi:amidohydrolase [Paenalkalicoccus suaedae]|uniref:Amidohydrolase n=1 Tax=Paenalkalicoccus suaedae TaxID=2592382 RepID=A0A859FC56_9BACI|nr:amidohydrolase [Paenalkalicoccus suaedae]QKS70331.1 amidohydrolase [Paenalkalicoccus suaedae]